jgi:hypothetical protein
MAAPVGLTACVSGNDQDRQKKEQELGQPD